MTGIINNTNIYIGIKRESLTDAFKPSENFGNPII